MWLLDRNANRSGRTFLLAYAFILIAKKQKGKWVRVFDHSKGDFHTFMVIEEIKNQLETLNEKAEFNGTETEFRIIQ
jgi:hypothetical protein